MTSKIDEKLQPTFPVSDAKDCLFLNKKERCLENVNINSMQMSEKSYNSSATEEEVSGYQRGYQKGYFEVSDDMESPKISIPSNSEAKNLKESEGLLQRRQKNIEMTSETFKEKKQTTKQRQQFPSEFDSDIETDASPETNFMTRNSNMNCFKLQQQIIHLQNQLLKAKNKELNYFKEERSLVRELREQVKKMSDDVVELKELVREMRGSKSTTDNIEASSTEIDNNSSNEYHLGKGVFVERDSMERIFCFARKPSAFVGSVAALVFTEEVLVNHSVTGLPCRNVVDAEQLPTLDPTKLSVIFECYKNWLNNNNFSEAEKKEELEKFVLYLNTKRSTIKRKLVQNGEIGIAKKRQLKVQPIKGSLKRKALEESINLSHEAIPQYYHQPMVSIPYMPPSRENELGIKTEQFFYQTRSNENLEF